MKKFKGLMALALMGAMFLSCFSYVKAETVASVPIYRRYNPGNGEHFYTKDKAEADSLVTIHGWNDEGIGWYSRRIRQITGIRYTGSIMRPLAFTAIRRTRMSGNRSFTMAGKQKGYCAIPQSQVETRSFVSRTRIMSRRISRSVPLKQ